MKELIKSELRLWAKKYLTPNSPHFNGMPACPFAENALERDHVEIRIGFGWSYSSIMDTARRFPQTKSIVIHAEVNPEKSSADFHKDLNDINPQLAKSNLWLIGFHPDDPDPDFADDDDFTPLVDEPYAMVFVQRLTELDDASRQLEAQRYYKGASSKEVKHLYQRRQAREEYEDGYGKKTRRSWSRQESESTQDSDGGETHSTEI
jgi:hypothetical protein